MTVSAVSSEEEDAAEQVTIHGAGGFGFPVRYRVEVHDDPEFERSRTVVDRTDEDQSNPGIEAVSFSVDADSARYVRVTTTDLYEFDPANPSGSEWPQLKTEYVRRERRL